MPDEQAFHGEVNVLPVGLNYPQENLQRGFPGRMEKSFARLIRNADVMITGLWANN